MSATRPHIATPEHTAQVVNCAAYCDGRKIGDVPSQAFTTGLLFLSCALSWTVFSQWTWGELEPFTVHLAPFIHVGDFKSDWSLRIHGLSAVMLVVRGRELVAAREQLLDQAHLLRGNCPVW